jgi:hypothetical protein
MTSLAALQKCFLNAIFDANVSEHLDFIQPNVNVSAVEQFHIYKNNVFSQLTKALKNIYPVCFKLVGEDFFNAMAVTYIRENPSVFVDLNEYGENFPPFIAAFAAAQLLPYLADTAKLEWALHRIYGAPDSADFPFEKFAAVATENPDKIIFHLTPLSSLIASSFPIQTILEANYNNAEAETIVLGPPQDYFYFIFRHHFDQQITLLSAEEWWFLSAIQKQTPLNDLCNIANAESLVTKSIQNHWLTSFSPES